MYKLNASKNNESTNQRMLENLEKNGWVINRFGHATKTINGEKYRFKFQSLTIRYEVQVNHEATQYNKAHNSWVRLRTYKYKK